MKKNETTMTTETTMTESQTAAVTITDDMTAQTLCDLLNKTEDKNLHEPIKTALEERLRKRIRSPSRPASRLLPTRPRMTLTCSGLSSSTIPLCPSASLPRMMTELSSLNPPSAESPSARLTRFTAT